SGAPAPESDPPETVDDRPRSSHTEASAASPIWRPSWATRAAKLPPLSVAESRSRSPRSCGTPLSRYRPGSQRSRRLGRIYKVREVEERGKTRAQKDPQQRAARPADRA